MTKFLRPRPAAKLLAETDAGNVVLVQRLGSAGPGVSGRLRGEYGETDDKERRLGGSLFFNTPWNLAVDGQWDSRREHLPGPPSHRNAFWTGDANLVYRLAPTDTIGIRSGVGVNLLHDHGKTDAGFNLTYATEFFIRRPWLVSADVDWGSVGGETVFHWRATAGWLAGRLELYVGYDHYEVGDRKFAGPLAGAGLWF